MVPPDAIHSSPDVHQEPVAVRLGRGGPPTGVTPVRHGRRGSAFRKNICDTLNPGVCRKLQGFACRGIPSSLQRKIHGMSAQIVRPDDQVSELVLIWPAAQRAFELLRIDYCCNANRSAAAAADVAGIDLYELTTLITDDDRVALRASSPPYDFGERSLTEQVDYIIVHHHRFARRQLLRLDRSIRQVLSGHHAAPGLSQISSVIGNLLDDLIPHMSREERYLFPYMRSLEGNMNADEQITMPLHGDLQYPLASIQHDHADDSARLDELRDLAATSSATDGCAGMRNLIHGVSELEQDVREHIRIENAIVFPKAVALEQAARTRATTSS